MPTLFDCLLIVKSIHNKIMTKNFGESFVRLHDEKLLCKEALFVKQSANSLRERKMAQSFFQKMSRVYSVAWMEKNYS